MTVQYHFNPVLPVIGEASKFFTDTVQKIAGDEIHMRVYEAGKLVPTFETLDAVRDGTLDAALGWPGYFMGKIPALTLFSAVPFGPNADEYVAWMMQGNGQKLADEIFDKAGVHAKFCGVIAAEASGWFRKPINSVNDLKGLKVRYAGLGGEVLQKLGASVTVLSAGEIFPNLEKGVLDATEFSMPSIDKNLGFYKIAKNYYFPGWHQPGSTAFLMVNKKKWDSLSETQQGLLNAACDATTSFELAIGYAEQGGAMKFFKEQGVKVHTWSPEMMAAFKKASDEVMAEQSEKDADFKRIYEDQQAFLENLRTWSKVGAFQAD
ncbi:MAG TPA: TRAP transporter substrate-binding protein [Alphaproteobacteria bacterium]|nr:TRAP transporter substrate-binding protein [Alphaproteobacteria bacterium]